MNNSIDKNRITSVKISSNLKQHSVLLALCTEGGFQWMQVKGGWYDINGKTEDFPAQTCEVIYADKEKTHASVKITLPEIAFLWDETSPVICKLQLHPADSEQKIEISFGLTDLKADGSIFMNHGRRLMLRSERPQKMPEDKQTWLKMMQESKAYGINHYQFLNSCPPEAAFDAADLAGIWIEAESIPEAYQNHPSIFPFQSQLQEIPVYRSYPDFNHIPESETEAFFNDQERLKNAGMGDLAEEFFTCSGKLAVQCYKKEIESIMQLPEMGGFCLPSEAFSLVRHGLISPERWNGFCSDTVLLGQYSDDVLTNHLSMNIFIRHHGISSINAPMHYRVKRGHEIIAESDIPVSIQGQGLFEIGKIDLDLKPASHVHKVRVFLSLPGKENSYKLWQMPETEIKTLESTESLCITSNLTEMKFVLKCGGNVLYFPEHLKNQIPSVYEINDTLGLNIDKHHRALGQFRCERWSTPQWREMITHADCAVLDGIHLHPIIQMIDNPQRTHKLGLLFECNVEKGKLLICMIRLSEILSKPEANRFAKSIIDYASSEAFAPKETLTFSQLDQII